MKASHSFLINFIFLFACISQSYSQKRETIFVDASKIENRISPFIYGSCIEDVNHEIYGGLYDQKIFGESFEEPVSAINYAGFTSYDVFWQAKNGELSVSAYPGGKMVYDEVDVANGTVETEIKFANTNGGNAGLLLCVSKPGKGADNFDGYEISLAANGSKLIVGKHKQNWQPVKELDVACSPLEWNKLKVAMKNHIIEISLNDKYLFSYEDKSEPFSSGKIALRTWNSDVRFRNLKIETNNKTFLPDFNGKPGVQVSSMWDAVQSAGARAVFVHDDKDAFNGKYSQGIQLTGGSGIVGICNKSLNRWGISVSKEQSFQGRLYLKGQQLKGSVKLALQSADGKLTYALEQINVVGDQWKKYDIRLTANTTDTNARFVIYIDKPGKLWIDQVTLMNTKKDQFENLLFRKDIGQAMVKQGLTFLRYGGTMVNAPEYRFKKMIGDPDKRPPYRGHWYPFSTNGFGIEEFVKFCEVAGFKAAFAINIEETPEDIADMVEYLNGSSTSIWGKKRMDNGHEQPYGIKYIEIGNEEVINTDDAEGYKHYIERFNLLYDAIKSKDSSVLLINSAWWRPESANMEMVFKALDGKASYWDYHPWADELNSGKEVEKELKRMKELFHQWNATTQMKCAIFEENGNLHNMQRALGHVTIQNAVRRHGDFVLTSCTANALQPHLQNDNGWDQGQIFFTPNKVWGMPPYYAQQMAAQYHQQFRVYSEAGETLDVTATRDEKGTQMVLHVANVNANAVPAEINIAGLKKLHNVKAVSLSANLNAVNTLQEPEKIIPVQQTISKKNNLVYNFPAYSYTILIYSEL